MQPASVRAPRGTTRRTPRDTPEPGLRIAFVADPDGNLVELLSRDGEAPPT
jgi:lactoylglutathione lyase